MAGKILIVDREPQAVRRAQAVAKTAQLTPIVASTHAFARELLATERPDIALIDVTSRDTAWLALVRQLQELDPDIAIIATGHRPGVELVMEAMRQRIADFLEKPLSEDQLSTVLARVARSRTTIPPSAPIDLLFIDDDSVMLAFAARHLSPRGIACRTASGVPTARAAIYLRRPDVIVTDVVLQGHTGLELVPEMATFRPPIPVILVSGYADPTLALKALREGAFAAFPKPVDWDELYKGIVAARRHAARQQVEPAGRAGASGAPGAEPAPDTAPEQPEPQAPPPVPPEPPPHAATVPFPVPAVRDTVPPPEPARTPPLPRSGEVARDAVWVAIERARERLHALPAVATPAQAEESVAAPDAEPLPPPAPEERFDVSHDVDISEVAVSTATAADADVAPITAEHAEDAPDPLPAPPAETIVTAPDVEIAPITPEPAPDAQVQPLEPAPPAVDVAPIATEHAVEVPEQLLAPPAETVVTAPDVEIAPITPEPAPDAPVQPPLEPALPTTDTLATPPVDEVAPAAPEPAADAEVPAPEAAPEEPAEPAAPLPQAREGQPRYEILPPIVRTTYDSETGEPHHELVHQPVRFLEAAGAEPSAAPAEAAPPPATADEEPTVAPSTADTEPEATALAPAEPATDTTLAGAPAAPPEAAPADTPAAPPDISPDVEASGSAEEEEMVPDLEPEPLREEAPPAAAEPPLAVEPLPPAEEQAPLPDVAPAPGPAMAEPLIEPALEPVTDLSTAGPVAAPPPAAPTGRRSLLERLQSGDLRPEPPPAAEEALAPAPAPAAPEAAPEPESPEPAPADAVATAPTTETSEAAPAAESDDMKTHETSHRPTEALTPELSAAVQAARPSLATLALANLPSGILVMDERPAVVDLNPAAEELLAVARDHALGGGVEVLPQLEPFFEAAQQVLTSGQGKFHQEAQFSLTRGHRTMGFGAVPLQHGSERIGVLLYFQDITARQAAQTQRRQVERLASLGLIAAGLTEELADPIHKANIYADLIQKEESDVRKCHQHAAKLRAALQRASQLSSYVARLLHSPSTEMGPCEMHEIIRGVTGSLQRKTILGSHPVDLQLAANASVIIGEAIDFEHLVMTLLVETSQAVPIDGALRVATRNHTGIFEMIVEARAQAGTGNAGDTEAADRTSSAAVDICRSLVRRYNGAIRIESDGDVLQRFVVRLRPALPEQCTGWAVQGVPPPPIATHHPPGEVTIGMIVADATAAKDCRRWVEESGLSVIAYATPEAALDGLANGSSPILIAQGPADQPDWIAFLRRATDMRRAAVLSLLDASVSPRLRADLDELPGHRSLRQPLDRLQTLQALALAELEGLDLQRAARRAAKGR